MAYRPNDSFAQRAKREHFAARSVYKLQEMDERWGLFRSGDGVIDLGCAPGSWSQYASQRVGPKGWVLGLDLTEVSHDLPNATFLQADIYEADLPALAAQHGLSLPADVVISDMAPKTTGMRATDQARSAALCEYAFYLCQKGLLAFGGHFVCKMFEGPDTQPFHELLKQHFSSVHRLRPSSTRKSSKEFFFVGRGFTPSKAD